MLEVDAHRFLRAATYAFAIDLDDTRCKNGMLMFIEGGWAITAAHTFPEGIAFSLRLRSREPPADSGTTCAIHSLELGRNLFLNRERDLAVLHLNVAPHRSLVELLPLTALSGFEGAPVVWRTPGPPLVDARTTAEIALMAQLELSTGVTMESNVLFVHGETKPGNSGAFGMVTMGTRYRVLVGPLIGTNQKEGRSYFRITTRGEFLDARASLSSWQIAPVRVGGVAVTSGVAATIRGTELHNRSWLAATAPRYPSRYMGHVANRSSPTFHIERSRLANYLPRELEPIKVYGAPATKAHMLETSPGCLEWADPYSANIAATRACGGVSRQALEWAIEDFVGGFNCPEPVFNRMLTIEEAIFGIPGIVRPMDLTKAAGQKLGGKKLDHVIDGVPSPELVRLVNEKLAQLKDYAQGGVASPYVAAWKLKEELRSASKIEQLLTRCFNVLDFHDLIVQRIIVLAVVMYQMSRPIAEKEHVVGINAADSNQWGAVATHISRFGVDRMMDADNVLFDKHQYADYLWGVAVVNYKLSAKIGCTPEHCDLVYAAISLYSFCDAIIDNVVLSLEQQLPSGAIATDIFNSNDQSLLMRDGFFELHRLFGGRTPTPRPEGEEEDWGLSFAVTNEAPPSF